MLLGKLFSEVGLELPQKYENIEISDIVTDSRRVTDKCMFICVRGHNNDGHEYIDEAIKNGAVVIVAEQVRDDCVGGAAIVKVENTRRAAALLYNIRCGKPSDRIKLVGVTGTNGKTSVCFMLESIFLRAGIRCAVVGTLGCRVLGKQSSLDTGGLTTPDPSRLYPLLAKLADMGITHVFMEVSSHSLALGRVDGLNFEWGIFTNLTRDHLDFHGSMEEYFRTKAKLFARCRRTVINTDDAYGKKLFRLCGGSVACSRVAGDVTATDITYAPDGTHYRLIYEGGEFDVKLGALGDFAVTNSLEAAAVALDAGISPEHIADALEHFSGAPGRMERVETGAGFDVIIDYAHTPDALEKLLVSTRIQRRTGGRVILVFGCGGDRDRGKRKEMAHIASRLADYVIVTSDNPRSEEPEDIIRDIMKGIDKEKPHETVTSRKEAIERAVRLAYPNDTVVLAGKGHERYEIDADGKHDFDERDIVRAAVGKKTTHN